MVTPIQYICKYCGGADLSFDLVGGSALWDIATQEFVRNAELDQICTEAWCEACNDRVGHTTRPLNLIEIVSIAGEEPPCST